MVYDLTSRDSYNALGNWLGDARTLASPNIMILCVGNKKDLEEERQVTFMEASRFSQENGINSHVMFFIRSGVHIQEKRKRGSVFT